MDFPSGRIGSEFGHLTRNQTLSGDLTSHDSVSVQVFSIESSQQRIFTAQFRDVKKFQAPASVALLVRAFAKFPAAVDAPP
jgi:hypothetical protein